MKVKVNSEDVLSRRKFIINTGEAAAVVLTGASKAVADVCSEVSAAQTSGPFPPEEAMETIRGQSNKNK